MNDGYTLLELLVATTLSSIISILLFTYYGVIAKNYSLTEQFSEAINNSNYVYYLLSSYFTPGKKLTLFANAHNENSILKLKEGTDALAISEELNGKFVRTFFYVSPDQYNNDGFFVKELNKPRVQISSNISDMQVLYAIKCFNSDNICRYSTARDINNWSLVKGVNILLTVVINPQIQKTIRAYFAIKDYSIKR